MDHSGFEEEGLKAFVLAFLGSVSPLPPTLPYLQSF